MKPIALSAACLIALAAAPVAAQAPPAPPTREEIATLAKAQVAIGQLRDSINIQLAQQGNKTADAQRALQQKLRERIAEILHHNGVTEEQYRRNTYVVSTDGAARKTFDSVVVALTGAPIPGTYVAPPSGRGNVPMPAGPVGTHLGHVVNGFGDTPMNMGLLPTALGEARVAAQHATLAARQPGNLDYMKTHAGHVIHALDATIVAAGPGLGYGVRKAANGVASHIELAATAQGASPNVITHARHIATSARNTLQRADQLLALAQKVQAATSAAEAAALVSQMISLADQLTAGADVNGDGRITWEQGEGGLQQADEHVKLLLAAEMR